MMSFEMNADVAMEFYRRAQELGLVTEEERTELLIQMAQAGLINRVVKTDRTKEQYIADLKKNFGLMEAKDFLDVNHSCPECFDPEATMDAIWTRDSETGELVLMDRKTNKEIMRRPK